MGRGEELKEVEHAVAIHGQAGRDVPENGDDLVRREASNGIQQGWIK